MRQVKLLVVVWLLVASSLVIARDEAIGCYAVQIASPSGKIAAKAIRLTSEAATAPWGTDGALGVVPATPTDAFEYPAAYWKRERDDLVVTFSNNGLSGVQMRVLPTLSGFRGTIERFRDFKPWTTEARDVLLTRTACSSSR